MSWKDHRRSNLSVLAILHVLEEEGLDSAQCLIGTDLTRAEILSADFKLSDAQEIEITAKALNMLPDRAGYGIRVGKALPITTYGIWGLAILASPNMREAYSVMARFSELSFILSKVRLVEDGKSARAVVDMKHLPSSIRRFLFERYYSGSMTFLREMMPGIKASGFSLNVPGADLTYARDLANLTGQQVTTYDHEYSISADHAWLDEPLPQADPLTHSLFVSQCQSLLNQRRKLPNYSQLIRDHIVQNNDYTPKIGEIASLHGMSARSFRRRLEQEDATFTQIVSETKMVLAKELLSTAQLSVTDVSGRLGYSEPASFTRAFTLWWGESPSKARRAVPV